jgi:hypothetical protein
MISVSPMTADIHRIDPFGPIDLISDKQDERCDSTLDELLLTKFRECSHRSHWKETQIFDSIRILCNATNRIVTFDE